MKEEEIGGTCSSLGEVFLVDVGVDK